MFNIEILFFLVVQFVILTLLVWIEERFLTAAHS